MKRFNDFTRRTISALFAALLFAASAYAQTTAFTYQGKLTDGAGAAGGSYDMRFRLYDTPQPNTGTQVGADQIFSAATNNAVNVSNGVFTVTLDFSANPFAAGATRYLEIAVKKAADANYTTLDPRQMLTSSPYSIRTLSAGVADNLSANCVGCVTNGQINSVDGAKVMGTVANATNATNATNANNATTATTAGNVTGIVGIANGGTGSATQNFVDLTTNQTIAGAKTFADNLRTNGLTRAGSEDGTFDAPGINFGTYNGLVTRRINSFSRTAGRVTARTNVLRLERDGSIGGWRIANDALTGFELQQSVHCIGINTAGAVVPARIQLSGNAAGTSVLYTDAQNIEYMQCSFGNAYNNGHQTQVVLQRYPGDNFWTGTVTSTFNQ